MPKKDFVAPDKYSILVPYEDFVKLVDMAKKVDQMEKHYQSMEARYGAIQDMFRECLDKIADLNRAL